MAWPATGSVIMVEAIIPSLVADVDDCSNRWVFQQQASPQALPDLYSDLTSFYNDDHGAGASPSHFYSPQLHSFTPGALFKTYDITGHLDGTPHGPPIDITTWTFDASGTIGGAAALAAQLAVVVDYHSDLTGVTEFGVHSRPRARHRGRHYLGCLNVNAEVWNSSTKELSVNSGFVDALTTNYSWLLDTSTHWGPGWVQWSRVDVAVRRVIGGWVDNTVHVNRRRQDPAGVKSLWS